MGKFLEGGSDLLSSEVNIMYVDNELSKFCTHLGKVHGSETAKVRDHWKELHTSSEFWRFFSKVTLAYLCKVSDCI